MTAHRDAPEAEECAACKKVQPTKDMLQTPIGYYICEDQEECIARFSGWNEPPTPRHRDDATKEE